MDGRKGDESAGAILLVIVMGVGGLAYWWWKQGDDGRMALLWAVGRDAGYGPVPGDMVEQLAWLAMNRLQEMEGMATAFLLAGMAGIVEGTARRRAAVLSGFGLRLLRTGRVLLLFWLAALGLFMVVPVSLPYREMGACLSAWLMCGTFTFSRGIRRVQ